MFPAMSPGGQVPHCEMACPLSLALLDSSPKGRALKRGGKVKPLPLGEMALRGNDGEGQDAKGECKCNTN